MYTGEGEAVRVRVKESVKVEVRDDPCKDRIRLD